MMIGSFVIPLLKMGSMTNKFLGVIPARGGSKGVPKKNVTPLNGKPLINWTIEAAKQSKYLESIIVSSDCDEILQLARKQNVEALKRPSEFADDSSSMIPVLKHVLSSLEPLNYIIVLLQPTSPLRSHVHIDECIDTFIKTKSQSTISVCQKENEVLKYFMLDNGQLHPLSKPQYPFASRQDLPLVVKPNGAIYVISSDNLLAHNSLLTKNTTPYFMSDKSSVDIDTIEDFHFVEGIMKEDLS